MDYGEAEIDTDGKRASVRSVSPNVLGVVLGRLEGEAEDQAPP